MFETLELMLVISVFLFVLFYALLSVSWISKFKFISHVLIPACLFLVWLGLFLYQSFLTEKVFTILTNEYSSRYLTVSPLGELRQGQKIVGEFVATQSHLGIIGFRFWTFNRLNDDYLTFRIKNKSDDFWYYVNSYKADQFQPDQYFTFGFPPIPDSKNKRFVFEIESTRGKPGVAVGVSQTEPVFIAKYKFDKAEVLSNWQNTGKFLIIKLINLIQKVRFTAALSIYLIPLTIYLLVLLPVHTKYKTKYKKQVEDFIINLLLKIISFLAIHQRTFSVFIALLGVILDSTFVQSGDLTLLTLVAVWIVLAKNYKLHASFFFKAATVLLFVSSIAYIFNHQPVSQRFGAWVWVFMVFVLITSQIENFHLVRGCKRPNLG